MVGDDFISSKNTNKKTFGGGNFGDFWEIYSFEKAMHIQVLIR